MQAAVPLADRLAMLGPKTALQVLVVAWRLASCGDGGYAGGIARIGTKEEYGRNAPCLPCPDGRLEVRKVGAVATSTFSRRRKSSDRRGEAVRLVSATCLHPKSSPVAAPWRQGGFTRRLSLPSV